MKDNEIRGLLLQRYYERRREGMIGLEPAEFGGELSQQDINHVAVQLLEHGLIDGKKLEGMSEGLMAVMAKITAHGVDVIEGATRPPIAIHFTEDKSINVSGSQGVVIGNSNAQTLNFDTQKIIQAIDGSSVTEAEKKEAKSKLMEFLKLPLIGTLLGLLSGKVGA